jgi:hypothetical protein
VELARCPKSRKIVVAGAAAPMLAFELYKRGYRHVETTASCGLPRGQFDAALIDWHGRSLRSLECTLDWLVPFLGRWGSLVISVDTMQSADIRRMRLMLESLGLRLELVSRRERGIAIAARRQDAVTRAAMAG